MDVNKLIERQIEIAEVAEVVWALEEHNGRRNTRYPLAALVAAQVEAAEQYA